MSTVICSKYCPIPYCQVSCPMGALTIGDRGVLVASEKCHACGLCKVACMAWSLDKNLQKRSLDRLAGKS